MKKSYAPFAALIASLFVVSNVFAQAEWDWTSETPDNLNSQWRFYFGAITTIKGTIDETFRAFYAATGQDYKQALAESYDLKDFGMNGPYQTIGFHYDHAWKYWNFKWDMLFFDISTDTRAKRDYYIGVGKDISYGGNKYDHLMVPKGDDFSINLLGTMTDAMFTFTPITFFYGEQDDMRLKPSLELGLVIFGGKFEIDDGNPRGTTVYQNPPVNFVIGGQSESFIGGGAPKIGIGATFVKGLDGAPQWVSHVDLGYFAYDGSTKPFTSSSHREKELDISMFTLGAETGFVLPLGESVALTGGLRLQFLSLTGEIKSKEKDTEKIIAARERFDKSVDFTITTAMVYIGITY